MSSSVEAARRIALCVEYDGSPFFGWQRQSHAPSVQESLETALSRVANEEIRVVCAGRTDTGVHARAQVVHFDTTVERPLRAWVLGVNSNLPAEIAVCWAQPVPAEFHARFSARARRYRYRIVNRGTRPAIACRTLTWVRRPLDEARMQDAARHLVGEHDFSSYRALACQAKHPIRTVTRLKVVRHGEYVDIDIEANAFLHHMVRNIAGVLIAIGEGKADPDWAREVLEARDRALGGVTAPAAGLCFVGVRYPAEFGLPEFSGADISPD